jgi:hypothetical protein
MPVNGSVAPVCPVSRSQAPVARAALPIAVVRPTDLPSAIAAINQLITIVNTPTIFNNMVEFPPQRWQEVFRNTEIVRVYNPNDKEQWVDVERITNVVWQDSVTETVIPWEY